MAITITKQPVNATIPVGGTATFTVEATGEGLTYQWQWQSASGSGWSNSGLPTANSPTLEVPATEDRNGQGYSCLITDANGNQVRTYAVTLTIIPIHITKQPYSVAAKSNTDTVCFKVEAEGEGLTYQWEYNTTDGNWKNNSNESAVTSELTFIARPYHDTYEYRCLITDANGNQVRTNEVTLYIIDGSLSADKGLVSMSTLSDIADAIRVKTETTDGILPPDMAAMIEGLSVGSEVLTGTFTPSSGGASVQYLGSSLPTYENYRLVIYGATSYAVHEALDGTILDIAVASARYETINKNGNHFEVDHAAGSISYRTNDGAISGAFTFFTNVTYTWCYFELKGASA